MNLHDYQQKHVNQILESFKTSRSIMLQMPTGTGKTHVFCEIAKDFYRKGKGRILVLAHREELINQIKKRMSDFGMPAGIIKSGRHLEKERQIQIASVQTLCKRDIIMGVSLIIVDEAHHTPAETYKSILKIYQKDKTKLLGVTATPIRLDGVGFEDIFDKLICSHPFKWFIENKYLSPIRHYASDVIKTGGISIVKNEYDEKQAEEYYLDQKVMADLINSYKKFGENKKTIVFALTIKHAEEIAERFNQAGYTVSVISSKTASSERNLKVEHFKTGKTQIVINVDIFSEGFDCPDVEVIQIARPTKSLVKYLQMAGRVTRKFENKDYAIILDNACLWQDHGLITTNRNWSLKGCETNEHDFSELIFSDGSSGKDAYEKKLQERSDIGMIVVDDFGAEKRKYDFTNKKVRAILHEYRITWEQLENDFRKTHRDIDNHLSGYRKGQYRNERFISQELFDFIDEKYFHKKLKKT